MHKGVKPRPHGQGLHVSFRGQGLGCGFQTGHWRQRALRQLQNLSNGIFLRPARQAVSAAFPRSPLSSFSEPEFSECFPDIFGYPLAGGDCIQRDEGWEPVPPDRSSPAGRIFPLLKSYVYLLFYKPYYTAGNRFFQAYGKNFPQKPINLLTK